VRGDLEAMGPACDIYSLGVVLFEMLTGRLPFRALGLAVVHQVLNEAPPAPAQLRPDVDPALAAVCARAMAKAPADRFPSMQALAAALTAYLKGDRPAARTIPPTVAPSPLPLPPTAAEKAGAEGPTQAAPPAAATTALEAGGTEMLARLIAKLDEPPAA